MDFGSGRSIDSWQYEWHHGGTGSHTYSNTKVTDAGKGNYYQEYYSGTSIIDGFSTPLSALLDY